MLQAAGVAAGAGVLAPFGGTIAAQEDDEDPSFVLVQDGECYELDPIPGPFPVEDLYDYRCPEDRFDCPSGSDGGSYSSEGTTHLQEEQGSVMFLYQGPNGYSLVFIHGAYEGETDNPYEDHQSSRAAPRQGRGAQYQQAGAQPDDDDDSDDDEMEDADDDEMEDADDDEMEDDDSDDEEMDDADDDEMDDADDDGADDDIDDGEPDEADDGGSGDRREPYVVSFAFRGLPEDGEWAVQDDLYLDPDTGEPAASNDVIWSTDTEPQSVHWAYREGRTDGGAFEGITEDSAIHIAPAFNESAMHARDDAGEIESWELLTGDLADPDRRELDMNRRVEIYGGTCDEYSS